MQEITNECERCEFKCVSDSENKKTKKIVHYLHNEIKILFSCLKILTG